MTDLISPGPPNDEISVSRRDGAQRIEPKDSPDDFPTPPRATRSLIEHALDDKSALAAMICLEPACGAGHMARVLKEYFAEVRSADAFDYGYAPVRNFLTYPYETNAVDLVVTNPHFSAWWKSLSLRALRVARKESGDPSAPSSLKALGVIGRFSRKTRLANVSSSSSVSQ